LIMKIADFMNRMGREEKGLTLIELMIVLAIVAVIMALAIPQLGGFRSSALEQTAQSDAAQINSALHSVAITEGAQMTAAENENFDDVLDTAGDDWYIGDHADLDRMVDNYDDDYVADATDLIYTGANTNASEGNATSENAPLKVIHHDDIDDGDNEIIKVNNDDDNGDPYEEF